MSRKKVFVMLGVLTGLGFFLLLCAGLVVLVLPWPAQHFDAPSEYPQARGHMVTAYGQYVRHLPEAIPADAGEVEFSASTEDRMQAEPNLKLRFVLPTEQALDEAHRLAALADTVTGVLPSEGDGGSEAGEVSFSFAEDSFSIWAEAEVDLASGEVSYSVSGD